ncbi:MAG TPA: SurA N-terminal domain-containing protein [Acetobacteraceae bacterium]|nr:SurA N-terminal domain-containing protein [Acetobacteraceae bacterium]
MLGFIRRHLNSWFVRILYGVLVIAFVGWGVGDMLRNIGTDTALAHVAGHSIQPAAAQAAYQRELERMSESLPSGQQPTAQMRQMVADQVVEQLVTQAAIAAELRRIDLIVPDAALRQAVFAMPAFQGSNGAFDRARFEQVLANNGLSEGEFLALMRQDLGQGQLLDAVGAGAASPATMTAPLFAFQSETRQADAVMLPFAAAPAPEPPDPAVLERWWANNPASFSTPEYRRIRLAVLSPDVLARTQTVSGATLEAAYAAHEADYHKPERRSAEILLAPDQAKAAALAARWQAGATWTEMQEAAKDAGASAVSLASALPVEFPDAALAKEVFAAEPGIVVGPFQTPLGWHVIEVTNVTPGVNITFAEAKPALEQALARQQAVNVVFQRVTEFEDAVAAEPSLEKLPGDLGLVGLTGTLDAAGLTPEGNPAPLPGSGALRQAIIKTAFATSPAQMASVVHGPGDSYYALVVQTITQPHVQPYDAVKAKVLADWTAHQREREQNEMATKLMVAVNSGTPLADAAAEQGLTAITLAPTRRDAPAAGVPEQLLDPLFALKLHQATMVETADGFVAAELMAITDPTATSDPIGYGEMRDQLTRSIGADLEQIFVTALRARAHPRINIPAVEQIAQQ